MKTISKTFQISILFLFLSNCNTGPQPIDYGNDGCHFCKMTIVDKIHGAELVTDKGKVYKFDATECMIDYLEDNQEASIGSLLTNYYEAPTKFISVHDATFLISKALPSPMGANLTAFKTKQSAKTLQKEKDGSIYNWKELKAQLKRN